MSSQTKLSSVETNVSVREVPTPPTTNSLFLNKMLISFSNTTNSSSTKLIPCIDTGFAVPINPSAFVNSVNLKTSGPVSNQK